MNIQSKINDAISGTNNALLGTRLIANNYTEGVAAQAEIDRAKAETDAKLAKTTKAMNEANEVYDKKRAKDKRVILTEGLEIDPAKHFVNFMDEYNHRLSFMKNDKALNSAKDELAQSLEQQDRIVSRYASLYRGVKKNGEIDPYIYRPKTLLSTKNNIYYKTNEDKAKEKESAKSLEAMQQLKDVMDDMYSKAKAKGKDSDNGQK